MNTIKYLFKSLYSNQTVLEGRKRRWIIPVIMFVLGFVMMWVPILSKGYTSSLSGILFNGAKTTNQEVDVAYEQIFESDYFKKITFTKNSNGKMNLKYNFTEEDFTEASNESILNQNDDEYNNRNMNHELLKSSYTYNGTPISYYYDVILKERGPYYKDPADTDTIKYEGNDKDERKSKYVRMLQAFYLDINEKQVDDEIAIIETFLKKNILRYTDDGKSIQNYVHSTVIFGKDRMYMLLAPLHSSKSASVMSQYSGLISEAIGEDMSGKTLYSLINSNTDDKSVSDKIAIRYQNYGNLIHKMSWNNHIKNVWINVLITSGIYVGVVLVISGVLIFIHKRKRSAYRDTTYWEALKESMVMVFTPSIVGLAVGFYNFAFQITLFVMFVLFRTFFMYSKIVPPAYTSQGNKPLYQARQ